MKVVQELLGHATIEMTTRYAHLSPDVPRHAVKLLDGLGSSRPLGDRWATRAVLVLNYLRRADADRGWRGASRISPHDVEAAIFPGLAGQGPAGDAAATPSAGPRGAASARGARAATAPSPGGATRAGGTSGTATPG